MDTAEAFLHEPVDVIPRVDVIVQQPWGVTVDGGNAGDTVKVIVRGVAPVRIRSMTYAGGAHYYARPTIRRTTQEPLAQLTGILETTDCACDSAASILYIDGTTQATGGGSTSAQVYWGLAIL